MKKLKKDLEAILKTLNGLAQKVQKLQEQIGEETKPTKKPKAKAAKKKAVPKKAKPATAVDTVLAIIKRSKKGVGTAALMEKTGYNQKKISNLVFKLKKQDKIKSVDKGIYLKA